MLAVFATANYYEPFITDGKHASMLPCGDWDCKCNLPGQQLLKRQVQRVPRSRTSMMHVE